MSHNRCYGNRRQRGGELVWDSGKTASERMAGIEWGGRALKSRERVVWRVMLWDETDVPGDWSEACFEMGLLDAHDWRARWISGDYAPNKKQRYPVDCFRKTFICNNAENARLYITACGLYEAQINGKRVGDFVMAPGFTDYRKRQHYQTYDVSELLHKGENAITVELADGWYRGSVGARGVRNVYGSQTKLLVQLETGGQTLISDGTWEWSNDGALLFADMKDGETADLRKSPTYSGRARLAESSGALKASNNVPVTEHEQFKSEFSKTPGGKTLLDFGQNIAGYVEIRVSAKAGQRMYLQFAEHLDENGELDMASIQCMAGKPDATPKQEIRLICKDGENCCKKAYMNQFTPIDTDRQSKLVRPLAFELLEKREADKTFERLVSSIEKRDCKIGTGFLSTPLILPLLMRMGRTDIAYKMMENEAEPGWLHEVKSGATTVWENWDGSASQNHYSPGSVCQWLIETVCGIQVAGENRFRISPQPGGKLGHASFTYKSVYGEVSCSWTRDGGEIKYEILVPSYTSEDVILPDGSKTTVFAGSHSYTIQA